MKLKVKSFFLFFCFLPCSFALWSNLNYVNAPMILEQVSCCKTDGNVSQGDSIPEQEAIRFIKDFYRAYIDSFLLGYDFERTCSVKSNYLTDRLIEKLKRVATATGVDPVVRAQDFNENMIKTLDVHPLGDDWYMVVYKWDIRNDSNHTKIPLKVIWENGRCLIDYITPDCNATLYGDSLLCNELRSCPIDNTHPRSFMKTFYFNYIYEYSRMPENLGARLTELRSKYLTSNALAQFEEAANEYAEDGHLDYDLLIDDFDFDCMWIPSITCTSIDAKTCQVRYVKWGNLSTTVTLEVVKQGKTCKIDRIGIK